MAGRRNYDAERLQELVLYIADKSIDDPRFGKTKLNKVLFFADFTAYQQLGSSITGAEYQHLPNGPAPHQMLPVLATLRHDQAAVIKGEETYAGVQHRIIALREPSLRAFTAEEVAIVDRVIDQLRPLTNIEVSELSHETAAWRLTSDFQEIPYSAAALTSTSPTDEDLVWLKEVAKDAAVGRS